jgi:plasmid stabilization system protein ParE
VKALQETPNIGRPVVTFPDNVRERLIGFGASVYVVRYRVSNEIILIIKIRHGREAEG